MTSKLIWKAALALSLMGWVLIAVRLGILLFGHNPHHLNRQSLIREIAVLILTTGFSVRALRRG